MKLKKSIKKQNRQQIGLKKQIKRHIYILTKKRETKRKKFIESQSLFYHIYVQHQQKNNGEN